MNYEYSETPLSRSLMAGLATGIVATIVNLIFNSAYRGITRLSLSVSVINVSTIIFATVLLCVIAGLVYHFIVFYLKKSYVIFVALFIVLTVLAFLSAFIIHRSADPGVSKTFEGLYAVLAITTGLSGAFGVPWFATHKNFFFD